MMRTIRLLLATCLTTVSVACATSPSATGTTPRPSSAPVGSTLLGARPACATPLMVEVTNPSPYEVDATLWVSDRTQRNLGRVDGRSTKRFPVPAGLDAVAVTAKGRGFDMTRMGGGTTSGETGGDIRVDAHWVCVAPQ